MLSLLLFTGFDFFHRFPTYRLALLRLSQGFLCLCCICCDLGCGCLCITLSFSFSGLSSLLEISADLVGGNVVRGQEVSQGGMRSSYTISLRICGIIVGAADVVGVGSTPSIRPRDLSSAVNTSAHVSHLWMLTSCKSDSNHEIRGYGFSTFRIGAKPLWLLSWI